MPAIVQKMCSTEEEDKESLPNEFGTQGDEAEMLAKNYAFFND
jgi:hypothetical protein